MKLIPALKLAMKLVTGKSKVPCLNHIRLSPGLIEATDLNLWLRLKTDYAGPPAILAVTPLKDALRKAKQLTLSPGSSPDRVQLYNGVVTVELQSLDPADYPLMPLDLNQLLLIAQFRQARLNRAQLRLLDHVSDDCTRAVLQWYLLEVHADGTLNDSPLPGMARLVATNGHSLSTANLRSSGPSEGDPTVQLVHPQALALLLSSEGSSVTVSSFTDASQTWVSLANDDCSVLMAYEKDLQFPNWRPLVTRPTGIVQVGLRAHDLQAVLDAASREVKGIHLAPNGDDCLVAWSDQASNNALVTRATLPQRSRVSGTHPRLHFAIMAQYLRALAARSPGILTIGMGAQCSKAEYVLGYSESMLLCADSGQEETEVTWLMPMRMDKQETLATTAAPAEVAAFLAARGVELGRFKDETTEQAA